LILILHPKSKDYFILYKLIANLEKANAICFNWWTIYIL